ncbi:MAG: DUF4388 domain-containing protein [Ardenticatenaceae bacterium]
MAGKAFKGKLRDFSLKQLLNLVHKRRKSGALSINAPQGDAELFFDRGKLIYASLSGQPNTLADLMVQANKLTRKEADAIAKTSSISSDKQLGRLLIQNGRVTQQEMLQALRKSMLEIVNRTFNWKDGSFVFDELKTPPTKRISIPVELENIVLEEKSQQEKATDFDSNYLPSLDVVLKFTEGRGRNLRSINLSIDEWRVISFINPRNTVTDIARHNQMSHDEVRRIVTKLIKDEVVEIAKSRKRGANRATAPHSTRPTSTKPRPVIPAKQASRHKPKFAAPKVEKGIISRLIARIRNL